MSVTEVNRALGSWSLRLRKDTPRSILNAIEYLGHIAVIPGRMDVAQYGDNLLAAARYVGVYRGKESQNEFGLKGAGLAFWLGDEDDKGDVFETAVELTAATFSAAITAVLPPNGSIIAGTLTSPGGTYTGRHIYETPRSAINYITETFGTEWRINNNGTLDAGPIANLYVTTPQALLMRRRDGSDLFYRALPGAMSMSQDVEDYTTRVLLLAEGEGETITTGDATAPSVPFKDIHGNDVVLTRIVSESGTSSGNADARAQLQLNRFSGSRNAVSLSTDDFDVKGDFVVGDYLYVFDPDTGFSDAANEIYWQGEVINPMSLRCIEMTWPIPSGWTVGFRRSSDGVWIDLSDYYIPESGDTTVVVGEFSRSLTSGGEEPIGTRPNTGGVDTSIPAAPAFTGFSVGTYLSDHATRAAIRAQWNTPLNLDTSVILDGERYEIRYRVNQTINYAVDWDDVDALNWTDLDVVRDSEMNDTFGRTVADNWNGSPAWTVAPTAAEFDVTPGAATIAIGAVNSSRRAHFGGGALEANQEILAECSWPALPVGGNFQASVITRYDPITLNYYFYACEVTPAGAVRVRIVRRTNTPVTEVELGAPGYTIPGLTYTAGTHIWIRAKVKDNVHRVKVWLGTAGSEPLVWNIIGTDPTPLTDPYGRMGVRALLGSGVSNTLPVTVTWYSVQAWTFDGQRGWDNLMSEPVNADPQWQTAVVGWGTNAFTLQELTPGVTYELQIRAVDSAKPPNFGPWSASSFVITLGDTIAPATPAPPVVASSRIAVQITHFLGRSSGGTFNLDLDIDHLEVHLGGSPSFFADATTKIGELIATASMVTGTIPAVGTFQVEQTDDVWIKVIAVDRAGNKSAASDAVQATALLIDDAHISDLTVSKVTAGTISATWLNSGRITTAESGARLELSGDGLDAYNEQGQLTSRLDGTDGLLRFYQPGFLYHPLEIGRREDGGYGMRVQDLFGETKLVVGQLDPNGEPGDSENYGLAAVEPVTGALVPLSRLAFGPKTDTVTTQQAVTSTSYTDLATVGPSVTVTVGTAGRLMVTVGALIAIEVASGSAIQTGAGYMTYDVAGPTGSFGGDSRAALLSFRYDIVPGPENTSYELSLGASRTTMLEGLLPGTYQITAKYRRDSTSVTEFGNRSLVVLPY